MGTLRLGTRGSDLARWQAEHVAGLLRSLRPDLDLEIIVITTTGDQVLDVPLAKIGGKGLFTKEIEEALLDRRIDCAVHSLKDLPTLLPDGLALGAVLSRTDPRDVWIAASGKKLREMPAGARIGTSSLRRQAQLLSLRSGFRVETLRGNVPTRLKKALSGAFDGIVLARAGVERLGFLPHVTEVLSSEMMLPAPGQGALGIEVRGDDELTGPIIASLEDRQARAATTAERAFLEALGGGCQVPIGALARHQHERKDELLLEGIVADPSGMRVLRGTEAGGAGNPRELGQALALRLIGEGAKEILGGMGEAGGAPLAGAR